MEDSRFDRLARGFAVGRSRRAVVKGVAGGLVAAFAGGRSVLADHKPGHCAKEGQQAHPHKSCCPGLIVDANGRCVPDPCAGVDCSELDTDCTVGVCSGGVCEAVASNDGGACSNGDPCTVGETCQDGACGGGEPLNCDDGNACTDDSCIAGAGCSHTEVECPGGNECQTAFCDPDEGCGLGNAPSGTVCDDGNGACNGSGSCVPNQICPAAGGICGNAIGCANNQGLCVARREDGVAACGVTVLPNNIPCNECLTDADCAALHPGVLGVFCGYPGPDCLCEGVTPTPGICFAPRP